MHDLADHAVRRASWYSSAMQQRTASIALGGVALFGVACSSPSRVDDGRDHTPRSEDLSNGTVRTAASALRAEGRMVSESPTAGAFPLFDSGGHAPLFVSNQDYPGVVRAAGDLRTDIGKVSGDEPELTVADTASGSTAVLIGTLGRSPLIDGLVSSGKLDASPLQGKWETFVIQPVQEPADGVDFGLVIAGSDKRGTIYGIYELSEEMGVSPWYYWADVPPRARSAVYIPAGQHSLGEPAVRYRGLFINDENPALYDWYNETFNQNNGRFNSEFYSHVFELILRLKGNYLWPAMWGKSFNVDDPQNPVLADEYGVVMGTSHHEPLTRSEQEWYDNGHTEGEWNYGTNGATLREFWRGGVERMGDRDTLLTMGMRGSGDKPNPDQGIALMESIVSAQRQIIQEVTGKDPAEVPQVWTLYKEVQDYYDQGMQVPEDIILMFADDNWGNLRRLPEPSATRSGGYGIYYHYDYVGLPRSYKWLNTNPIPRVWEQMQRAYSLGVDRVWIVNVGDIKPMEFPLHFWMDLAWDPEGWTAARLADYPRRWAEAQFGAAHAEEIGRLVSTYLKFSDRCKPEIISKDTYSVSAFREADRVVEDWRTLVSDAEAIEAQLPENMRDAYFQLVLHPILAFANLDEMYVAQARNSVYAGQGRASTNTMANRVGELFANDSAITDRYHSIAGGKWNHMMQQTHIGYTDWSTTDFWDDPETQVRPPTQTITTGGAALGVAVENSGQAYTPGGQAATLPELSVYYPDEQRYIEVFNRGSGSIDFTAQAAESYVTVAPSSGTLGDDTSLAVSVDWSQVPAGDSQATITVNSGGGAVTVQLPLRNPATPDPASVVGFVETDGYVSLDPTHYTEKVDQGGVGWAQIPDLGKTGSAVHIVPQNAASVSPGGDTPQLHYKMHFFEAGQVQVHVYLSPSLPVHGSHYGYALSFDDQAPQSVDMHQGFPSPFTDQNSTWQQWMKDNIIVRTTNLTLSSAGEHTLKLWMIDAGVVIQKIVVSRAGLPDSFLGPPTRLPLNFTPEQVVPDRGEPEGTGSAGGAPGAGGSAQGGNGSGGDLNGGGGAAASGAGNLGSGGVATGLGGSSSGTGGLGTGTGGLGTGTGGLGTGTGGLGSGGVTAGGVGGSYVSSGGTGSPGGNLGGNSSALGGGVATVTGGAGPADSGSPSASGDDDGSCSCRTAGASGTTRSAWAPWGALLLVAGAALRRRRAELTETQS